MQQPFTSPVARAEKPAYLLRSLTLMKPVTWFGPVWAFVCGTIASGATAWTIDDVGTIMLGTLLAGPVLCGVSQVINDYYDRDVDALNQPDRLIPAKLVSNAQIILTIALLLAVGVSIGMYLGANVALFSAIGLILAIMYSMPPFRAKRNGWIGNGLVGISYEGLAWLAGHAAFAGLTTGSVLIAALYSLGAHGIMTINDYKSIEGDRLCNINSIPVLHGEKGAAWLTVITMNLAQLGVLAAFIYWQSWIIVAVLSVLLFLQFPTQRSFIKEPVEKHLNFSAIGVSFFVWGMMAAAIGLRWLA